MDRESISQRIGFLFAPLRLITVALLFWALAKHSHNYYVILRWLVFVVALWGAYRSYEETFDKWFLVSFYVALMILFNPFVPITLAKSTWNIINVVTGFLIFISTWVHDDQSIHNDTRLGRFLGRSIAAGLGFGLLAAVFLFGLALINIATDRTLQNFRLLLGGAVAKAQIARVTHDVEEVETERRAGYRDIYRVEYSFNSDGKIFYGSSTLYENPVATGAEGVPAQPTFLDVEYQLTNPNNNRAVASSSKLIDVLPALLFLTLGVGAIVWTVNNFRTVLANVKRETETQNDREVVS